jgi:ESCRT-II complex subunit VPS36
LYTRELAKELSEFLSKVLDRHGGMMALTDLYCLFNRARGVALISPADLVKSCELFDALKLSYRMRKFDSGLLVVHSDILLKLYHYNARIYLERYDALTLNLLSFSDDGIATRIMEHMQGKMQGVTALDIAAFDAIPVILAQEQLFVCVIVANEIIAKIGTNRRL